MRVRVRARARARVRVRVRARVRIRDSAVLAHRARVDAKDVPPAEQVRQSHLS